MKCCGPVVLNTALGKEFYVCRGCKKEVIEEHKPELNHVKEVFDAAFQRIAQNISSSFDLPSDPVPIKPFISFASSYGKSQVNISGACRCADNFLCNYCYYSGDVKK